MRYREFKPNPNLAPFVECFWTLDSDTSFDQVQTNPAEPVQPERILPDGCVELILNFGAQFREQKDDGQQESQPMHFLVGQMTRPMLISPNGRVELVGIRFHPGGTLPFFRVDLEVGIGPKSLCRILRFQQVFRAVERNDSGWAAVATDCGYYDQAHLIRDFQQFARQTPAVLFAQPNGLTQAFTRKDRTSDFSNTHA